MSTVLLNFWMKEGIRKRFHVTFGEDVQFFFTPNSVSDDARASHFDNNFPMNMFLTSTELCSYPQASTWITYCDVKKRSNAGGSFRALSFLVNDFFLHSGSHPSLNQVSKTSDVWSSVFGA